MSHNFKNNVDNNSHTHGIKCNVNNCNHNHNSFCNANTIEVKPMGDGHAKTCDGTCCTTFESNNMGN